MNTALAHTVLAALMLTFSVLFSFFRDTDLRRAIDIAHRDRHHVGYLAICWFVFQYVSTLR
jgi:hypothetical protein